MIRAFDRGAHQRGRVLVDGLDVREMTQADLRARIGFVPQKAVLFTGTVAANIRYGREKASDEEVRHGRQKSPQSESAHGPQRTAPPRDMFGGVRIAKRSQQFFMKQQMALGALNGHAGRL